MHVEIRARGVAIHPILREHIQRRLLFALSRFGSHVSAIAVRLEDANGPRGGIDKVCRLQVRGHRMPATVVEACEADFIAAVDRAAELAGRTVARAIERARTTTFPGLHRRTARRLAS